MVTAHHRAEGEVRQRDDLLRDMIMAERRKRKLEGENSAEENAGKEQEKVPTMTVRIDKTTYVVGVHFSKTSKETLKDKLKRMILEEAKTQ